MCPATVAPLSSQAVCLTFSLAGSPLFLMIGRKLYYCLENGGLQKSPDSLEKGSIVYLDTVGLEYSQDVLFVQWFVSVVDKGSFHFPPKEFAIHIGLDRCHQNLGRQRIEQVNQVLFIIIGGHHQGQSHVHVRVAVDLLSDMRRPCRRQGQGR